MTGQRGRPRKAAADTDTQSPVSVKVPVSIASVINKSGLVTLFVLHSDGTILVKDENAEQWRTISLP